MSVRAAQAIVLRQWDFSETSQTVALFTRDAGLVRGLAKGARRDKAGFSGGFEVLTRGELLFISKQKTDLATITEWDLQEVFWGPRRSYRAHLAGLYLADLFYRTVAEDDPHPVLFDRAVALLRELDAPEAVERVVLQAQWRVLHETGSAPNLDRTPMGEGPALGFDPEQGVFVADPGPDGPLRVWRVRRETIALLDSLRNDDTSVSALEQQPLRRASALLAAFLVHTLGRDLPTRAAFFEGEELPGNVRTRAGGR